MEKIRKHKKGISLGLVFTMIFQIVLPMAALAGTEDDGQVEFSPSGGGGEIVNSYNGAMNYNIPLLSIPGQNIGYSVNLNYNSDAVKMLNTASMVGFGWNLNLGSISRQVQAVPDDFNNDTIMYFQHVKPFKSIDVGLGEQTSDETGGVPIKLELQDGSGKFKYTGHLYWDNYSGIGYRVGIGKQIDGVDVDLNLDTKRGVGYNISKDFGFISTGISGNMNSGLSAISLNYTGVGYGASTGLLVNSLVSPQSMPMRTKVRTGSFKLGLGFLNDSIIPSEIMSGTFNKLKLNHVNSGLLGSVQASYIKSVSRSTTVMPAYGYLYKGNEANVECVKDFIRYPFKFKKGTEYLPTSQLGTDIFIQSDQGSGGVFTARSKNFDIWSTTMIESKTKTYRVGGEFSINDKSTDFQVGVDVMSGDGTNYSGVPKVVGGAASVFTASSGLVNSFDELGKVPFVKGSEIQIEKNGNQSLTTWGGDEPYRVDLEKGQKYKMLNKLVSGLKETTSHHQSRGSDYKKQSYVQYLTTSEAIDYGRSRNFGYLKSLANNVTEKTEKESHIAEINVWETNGMVYTYSNPLYNNIRVDASFSLENEGGGIFGEGVGVTEFEKRLPNANRTTSGNVTFGKAKSVGADLHKGMELLNVSLIPKYATSWPVTMITSKNYNDLSNNGPSNDDIGSWVKFSYKKVDDDYKWRTPYEKVQVTDGVKGESGDDMGFYRYGEKELKYVDTIETKTHYAKFIYTNRQDAYPVKNQLDGGPGNSNPSKKLSRIDLYLKRNDLGDPIVDATLVQSVNLIYDYELVPGEISNKSGGGKLTLKSVYNTFYNSTKGQDYSYDFTYSDNDASTIENPKYNRANIDRWGNFKRNKTENNTLVNSGYPFQDFPYTEQADNEGNDLLGVAAPWCLRKVDLPTGSSMNFEYEHRDYAHVDDKVATKMYDILSVKKLTNETASSLSKNLTRDVPTHKYEEDQLSFREHVSIKLPSNYGLLSSNKARNKKFFEDYLEGIEKELFIKAYVCLNKTSLFQNEKDYSNKVLILFGTKIYLTLLIMFILII